MSVGLSKMLIKMGYRSSIRVDANYELQRLAKTRYREKLSVLEDENIDESYKVILFALLACKEKNNEDDVIKCNKRSEAHKKRKEIEDHSKHGEGDSDPQHEHFLKLLKTHDKSYRLEYEKDGLPIVIKYELDIESEKEGDLEPEPRRMVSRAHQVVNEKTSMKNDRSMLARGSKSKHAPSVNMGAVENQRKMDPRSNSVEKTSNTDKVEHIDGPHNAVTHKGHPVVNKRIPLKQDPRMLVSGSKHKYGHSDQMCVIENQHMHNPRSVLVKNAINNVKVECVDGPRNVSTRKGKSVVIREIYNQTQEKGGNLPRDIKPKIGISNQMPQVENQHCTSVKKIKSPTRGKSGIETNKEVNHVPMHMGRMEVFENTSEMNDRKKQPVRVFDAKRKQKYEKNDNEVVIIDEAAFVKDGISNPFVPSNRFDRSMEENSVGGSGESDAFRKEVLDILRRPYDKEEHKELVKAVQEGCYLKHHPEVGRKLSLQKYRYSKKRRLAIYRGFVFWLQNLTREGSFKPWKDRACLEVEPPSP